jgi:3-phenylpropionate/trans-cinnamate dioxygenase ferredoxin reductase subunit
MTSIDRIVIVGAGLAGAKAAEGLRKAGFDGSLSLIGDEAPRPYLRPPLSKDYLRGEKPVDGVFVHPAEYYDENRIDVRGSTTATAIDPTARGVTLDDGTTVSFDRLLIATGAAPRRLPVPGAELPGVHSFRTLADADALRDAVRDAERIAVIGAGWIGSEVAASLRSLGRNVVLIAPDAVPLERVLGPTIGGVYGDLHRDHGVELRLGTGVARIVGTDRVEAVETTAGDRSPVDLVVVGIGVTPRTALASGAGLSVGDGIEVSATLETSVPGIFAAGDVASAWHPFYGRRVRTEHWANARFGGAAAARSLLGGTEPYERIPYFYSDQYDVSMEYTGHATASDELVVRGSLTERSFVAFWLRGDVVVAGMNVNVPDVAKPIERMIRSRRPVDRRDLTDASLPLEDIGANVALAS